MMKRKELLIQTRRLERMTLTHNRISATRSEGVPGLSETESDVDLIAKASRTEEHLLKAMEAQQREIDKLKAIVNEMRAAGEKKKAE